MNTRNQTDGETGSHRRHGQGRLTLSVAYMCLDAAVLLIMQLTDWQKNNGAFMLMFMNRCFAYLTFVTVSVTLEMCSHCSLYPLHFSVLKLTINRLCCN